MSTFQVWQTAAPGNPLLINADAIDVVGGVLYLRTGDDIVASFAAGSWTYASRQDA